LNEKQERNMHHLLVLGENFDEKDEILLKKQEYTVSYALTEEEVFKVIKDSPPDLIIVDFSDQLDERLDILENVRETYEDFIKRLALLPERRSEEPELKRAMQISHGIYRKPMRIRDLANIIHKIVYNID
jgi:DNA-binding NarL/FixJ family response regulator